MGHDYSLDVESLHMFHGYEWVDLGDPCGHACSHRSTKVVGWGPTRVTYELVECCDCGCRGWQDGRYRIERSRDSELAFWWREHIEWREIAVLSEDGDSNG